jgi:hypothetical protein
MSVIINGTDGVTFNDASLQGAAASPYVLKNRIINGAMVVDQRNAGASVTITGSTSLYSTDRWQGEAGSSTGVYTLQQVSDAPVGFVNSLKATVTTAEASVTNNYGIIQRIEGYNIADLGWGTANAKTVTLSFWVKSSLTGSFGGSLYNSAFDRAYPFPYTISVANTWEQKTVTITGDITGTWLTTNGIGIQLIISLGASAARSATANAWTTTAARQPTSSVNLISTSAATLQITGVQLEVGSTATPFERRLYGQELVNCQRYYTKLSSFGASGQFAIGMSTSSTNAWVQVVAPVAFRASPTISYSAIVISDNVSYSSAVTSIAGSAQTLTGSGVAFVSGAVATQYRTAIINASSSSGYIDFSAEL